MVFDGAPPRPNGLLYMAELVSAKGDGVRQAAARQTYWLAIAARIDYLDAAAAAFTFDQPYDVDLPDDVKTGITRRVERVRTLVRSVHAWIQGPSPSKWVEAQPAYDEMERVAVSADHWIARGRADVAALRAARQRTAAAPRGGEEKRRSAEAAKAVFAKACLPAVQDYRKLHPDAPVTAIIQYLRRTRDLDESDPTLRRWLRSLGVKPPQK